MTVNITCLTAHAPLPVIPLLANESALASAHPKYTPSSGDLPRILSSSIFDSVFSTEDVRTLLHKAFLDDTQSWSGFYDIDKIKPMPSIILYSSIALAFFLILSIVFYVVSCVNCGKRTSYEKRGTRGCGGRVCIFLVIIVYLLGIGDMIYVAYRVNKSKESIDETIKYVNRDVYPKEVTNYLTYMIQQMDNLDRYSLDHDSILFNASKSMIVEAFDIILEQKYLLPGITRVLNRIDQRVQALNQIVDQDASIPQFAKELFLIAKDQYQSMMNVVQDSFQKVCRYADGLETDVDDKLFQALDVIHRQLRKIIDTLQQHVLDKIAGITNPALMDTKLEEQVRAYVSMSGVAFVVLVVLLTVIPVAFACFVALSCLCREDRRRPMKPHSRDIRLRSRKGKFDDSDDHDDFDGSSKRPSRVLLCLMRIAFTLMVPMLIVLVVLTGAFYTIDMSMHGGCRTVHDDLPFIVPFAVDRVATLTGVFPGSADLNTTAMDFIDDCREGIHFTGRLLKDFWPLLADRLREMMNQLSEDLFNHLHASIGQANVTNEIDLFARFANASSAVEISTAVTQINADLEHFGSLLANITASGASLSSNLTQSTIVQFSRYLKEVVESTIDRCPLPLHAIYRADKMVCHDLGTAIGGLWLNVFIYMFLVTVGLCIVGVWAYKQFY